jgi:hypothetical protein
LPRRNSLKARSAGILVDSSTIGWPGGQLDRRQIMHGRRCPSILQHCTSVGGPGIERVRLHSRRLPSIHRILLSSLYFILLCIIRGFIGIDTAVIRPRRGWRCCRLLHVGQTTVLIPPRRGWGCCRLVHAGQITVMIPPCRGWRCRRLMHVGQTTALIPPRRCWRC